MFEPRHHAQARENAGSLERVHIVARHREVNDHLSCGAQVGIVELPGDEQTGQDVVCRQMGEFLAPSDDVDDSRTAHEEMGLFTWTPRSTGEGLFSSTPRNTLSALAPYAYHVRGQG